MKKLLIIAGLFCLSLLNVYSQSFEKQGAGVTFIVHGWNPDGSQPAWMQEMANAIVARNDGNGHIASITVTGSQGNLSATCSNWGFDLQNQNHAEIVVLINWTDVANHLNSGVTAQEVAAAVVPKIYNGQEGEPPLSELPIHLIGHSRGGGMVFEIAKLLGEQGIEVDHLTALDPHPLTAADPQGLTPPFGPGQTIDAPINVYENILFADVYYQNIEYPEGEYVSGAYNRLWTSLPGGYHNETGYTYNILGTNYNFSDHLNIILAYHGTIDLSTPISNGEASLTQTERDAWFNAYENEGENTGFKYSRQILGDRKSLDTPVSGEDAIIDGYHNDILLGGNGAREGLIWTNAVWPNVLETNIDQNGTPLQTGSYILSQGDLLSIESAYRSYANASTLNYYYDVDRNPYNSNSIILEPLNLSATGSVIASSSASWSVSGLTPGEKFYIYAEIDDASSSRFFYAPYEFEYSEPIVNDLSVTDIVKPVKSFETSEITIKIENVGNQVESNFPVSYTYDGNTITETFTETINPGDFEFFVFNQTLDLSVENIYEISASTELSTDGNTGNNQFVTEVNTYVNPNALFFIYDDYLSLQDYSEFNFAGDFTLETWCYAHSTKSPGKVISKHGNDGSRTGYTIEYDGSNIRAVIGVGGGWATISAPMIPDQWHHVAMVYDAGAGVLEMFLNGVSQGTTTGTMLPNDLDLWIGASQQYGDHWTGYIDEVRIWDDIRTETEIVDNMISEINPQAENLLAYYDFNRGIPEGGNEAILYLPDMTDNNFHALLNNFALSDGLPDGNFFEDCDLDLATPVPDMASLPDIIAECEVTTLTAPTATDNCAGSITGAHDATLPITTQGTTTVIWTYNDGNGHIITQTQDVVIDDVSDPVPDVATLPDITAECEVTTLTAPTATDNCAGSITGAHDATLPITTQGTTTVIWTYNDGNGNIITQTQDVVIDDVSDPVPDVATLPDITAECEVTTLTAPTATDNCAGSITGAHDATLPIDTQGTTTVTWTYDDGNENVITQTQNVVIEDLTNPTITCIENQTINLEEGETYYLVQDQEFDPIEASDNCAIESLENDFNNLATLQDAQLPVGTTTIVWTIIDEAGNENTCNFDVTINDFVGFNDFSNTGISIYPNPTNGIVTIDCSDFKDKRSINDIAILDVSGKVLLNKSPKNSYEEFDFTHFSHGVYLIKVSTKNNCYYSKLIYQP